MRILFLIIATSPLVAICQPNKANRSSKYAVQFFEFTERTTFYGVDNFYNINKSRFFHVNRGFRVFTNYDIVSQGDREYIVFKYPDWSKARDEKTRDLPQVTIDGEDSEEILKLLNYLREEVKNLDKNLDSQLSQINHIQERLEHHEIEFKGEIIPLLKKLSTNFSDDTINKLLEEISTLNEHYELKGIDDLRIAIDREEFERLKNSGSILNFYSTKLKYGTSATGVLTVPFKLRPKIDTLNTSITTDVTLGAFWGWKSRISHYSENYLIFPVISGGLSYINVSNNETSNISDESADLVPGITWSVGAVLDLKGFNIGFVLGRDYASKVGNDWIYHGRTWYSFSIGYSFVNKRESN